MILEHLFLGELLRYIWQHFPNDPSPEVMSAGVDDSGYDIVLEWRGVLRHIQLKGRAGQGAYIRVNRVLSRKPAGCVVLLSCGQDLASIKYSLIGASPPGPLDLTPYRKAKRLRANRLGIKAETLSTCLIPVSAFEPRLEMADLVKALFGPEPAKTTP